MSIRIMSLVWENGPSNSSECLLLLALADYADEFGECYPSIAALTKKARLSERGVQTILRRLEAAGWIEIEPGNGRKNCNLYRIKTPHMDAETPHQMHPAPDAPPHMDAKNPAPGAPKPLEPSVTIEADASMDAGASPVAIDFTKEVFDRGVAFLRKYGTHEKQARALIGKWRKQVGDTETFNALRDANREGVTDPIPWITARINRRKQPENLDLSTVDISDILAQFGGNAR